MSSAVGMRVLPVEMDRLLGVQASQDPQRAVANAMTQAGGASIGYAAALYKSIIGQGMDEEDAKRWEGLMPKFMSNISHAWRYYNEGMERNARGNPIVRFDPNEPVHMMEILARAAGFQPARLTQQWDKIRAQQEAKSFWTLQHDYLLRELWWAKSKGDTVAYERAYGAVQNFNQTLPDIVRGYRITGDTIRKSFQTRGIAAKKQGLGIPLQKRDIPMWQEIQRMHPGAQPVGMQRVD